jgi:hypothetical protein
VLQYVGNLLRAMCLLDNIETTRLSHTNTPTIHLHIFLGLGQFTMKIRYCLLRIATESVSSTPTIFVTLSPWLHEADSGHNSQTRCVPYSSLQKKKSKRVHSTDGWMRGCGDAGLQRGFLRGRDEVWDRRCSSVPLLVPLVIS